MDCDTLIDDYKKKVIKLQHIAYVDFDLDVMWDSYSDDCDSDEYAKVEFESAKYCLERLYPDDLDETFDGDSSRVSIVEDADKLYTKIMRSCDYKKTRSLKNPYEVLFDACRKDHTYYLRKVCREKLEL